MLSGIKAEGGGHTATLATLSGGGVHTFVLLWIAIVSLSSTVTQLGIIWGNPGFLSYLKAGGGGH